MIYFFKVVIFIALMIHAVIGIKRAFNHFLCALVSICWFKKTNYPIDWENFQHHTAMFIAYVGGLIIDGFIAAYFIFRLD